ncbi:MAG: RsmD family RNA methyltransferase [Sedimentisphaerales bacterium]|nr:RsmD family RNA methyltransferase [Sedimentisphaerales bacterium]
MTLLPPRDLTTRPITDRVKESVFAILTPRLPGAVVADLFCGTGSLGLEALSRGARWAIMVDTDKEALKRLRKNVEKLRFDSQVSVVPVNAFRKGVPNLPRFVSEVSKPGFSPSKTDFFQRELNSTELPPAESELKCNLVFVDPPYKLSRDTAEQSPLGKLLEIVSGQVANRGLVVVRHERRSVLLKSYADLYETDRREYGSMAVTFLEKAVE